MEFWDDIPKKMLSKMLTARLVLCLWIVSATIVALKPSMRFKSHSSGKSNQHHISIDSTRLDSKTIFESAAAKTLSTAATLSIMASFIFQPPLPAMASVAPLADVGLREFLVKDGRELLRLSLPSSMTKDAPINLESDPGRQCQEAIELVRLRLEQVGFSGKKVRGEWQERVMYDDDDLGSSLIASLISRSPSG